MKTSYIPAIDTDQMREVDRLMIEVYGISLPQMMENAGRNLAEQAMRMLKNKEVGKRKILVLCGLGNNGGGGLAAARHLHNRGAKVDIQLISHPERLKVFPALQWKTLSYVGFSGTAARDISNNDLIIDAMIGYGLQGNPRAPVSDWIEKVNGAGRAVLALDAPSGLDTTSGKPGKPCIKASETLTLALPKVGLLYEDSRNVVGELFLADISVPPALYKGMGIDIPPLIFSDDSIVPVG